MYFACRIEIEWGAVATITSTQRFQIELGSGALYYGTVSSPSAGHLEVKTDTGPVALEMTNVVRITPMERTFLERTTGAVDFGFDLVSPPNPTTSWELEAEVKNRTKHWITEATLDSLLERAQGTVIQTRNFLDFDTKRLLGHRWFAYVPFQYEQDKFLSLSVRITPGLGVGRTVVQAEQTNLSLCGGFNYNGERFSHPYSTNNSAEAFGGLKWGWFPAGKRADLQTKATTFISLERPRVRLYFDSELREYVIRRLFWGLEVFESFDSDPGGNREQSDFGAAITLGWRF